MEEMQNKAVVFFVFYSWSAIEIFRWVHRLPVSEVYVLLWLDASLGLGQGDTCEGSNSVSVLGSGRTDRCKALARAQTAGT